MIGHARDSRFPPPWMVQDQNDDRFAVACFYYDRRAAANLMTRAERRVGESRFANCRYLAACRQGFADRGNEDYSNRRPSRASIIRLASATISSVRLFSRLEGLSANGRVDPGAKIEALQPFPTELTSIRYPLYSMTVIACAMSIRRGPHQTASQVGFERGAVLYIRGAASGITHDCHVGWAEIFVYRG